MMGKTSRVQNREGRTQSQQNHGGKTTPKLPCVSKNEERGCMAEWPTFLGIFLAKEVKTRFSKMGP